MSRRRLLLYLEAGLIGGIILFGYASMFKSLWHQIF